MKPLAIAAALLLSACQTGPTWKDVRKDAPIFDTVQRQSYLPLERLQVACVRQHGHFTRDLGACMVQKHNTCVFLTAPADARHDPELTALCNGWRA